MSDAVAAIRTWLRELIELWDRFWFTPTDPATLSLIRVFAGAMLLYTHLVWTINLSDFFGADGWLSAPLVHEIHRDMDTWSYFWWVHSPAVLWMVHLAALAVFALLTVGLFSRIVAPLAAIATLSYIMRVPGALFGLDQINALLAIYLCIGPCGARYSVDSWLAKRKAGQGREVKPSTTANIALRLIQIHMCIIYAFAGTSKLMGNAWWDGSAMWFALGNYEYQSLDMTWLSAWPRSVSLLSHITIVWETFYCVLIWPRRTRPVMLALAVPLHLGIAVCLGMVTFGLVMLIANLAFVPAWFVRRVIEGKKSEEMGSRI
jgi:uncharacterized membrane protein YphA (DoxX/SURF4 family)